MTSTLCCVRPTIYVGLISMTQDLEKSYVFLDRQKRTDHNTQKDTKNLLPETWMFPRKFTLKHNSAIAGYFSEDAAAVPLNLPHIRLVVSG